MAEFGYLMLCEPTPPRRPVADLVQAEAARPGEPRYARTPVACGPDPEEALSRVTEPWSRAPLPELSGPKKFEATARFVRPEDAAEALGALPDPRR